MFPYGGPFNGFLLLEIRLNIYSMATVRRLLLPTLLMVNRLSDDLSSNQYFFCLQYPDIFICITEDASETCV